MFGISKYENAKEVGVLVRISPEDVGKRIDMHEISTSKKVVGIIETVTKRLIVITTDSHVKFVIPFTLLEKKYTIRVY